MGRKGERERGRKRKRIDQTFLIVKFILTLIVVDVLLSDPLSFLDP